MLPGKKHMLSSSQASTEKCFYSSKTLMYGSDFGKAKSVFWQPKLLLIASREAPVMCFQKVLPKSTWIAYENFNVLIIKALMSISAS